MRGGIKRSRNGCSNCKEKRLKCDETKPACKRCATRMIPCDGYKKAWKWSAKYQTAGYGTEESGVHTTEEFASAGSSLDIQGGVDLDVRSYGEDTAIFDISAFDSTFFSSMGEFDNLHDFSNDPFKNDGMMEISSERPSSSRAYSTSSERTNSQLFSSRRLSSSSSEISRHRVEGRPSKSSEISRVDKLKDRHLLPISKALTDQSSFLVEYYFKEVAGLFSCYDGRLNPFRSNVSQLWGSSAAIYYTVQSMATACLVDVMPNIGAKGLEFRNKATAAIDLDLSVPHPGTASLLALVMLGLSSSWHDSNDLGQAEFDRAQRLFASMESEQQFQQDRNLMFFRKALVYWEMLMSYVVDDNVFVCEQMPVEPSATAAEEEVKFPHPWTGIACEAQALVFEVGKLIRQGRSRMRRRSFTTEGDMEQMNKDIQTALVLEARLQELSFPEESAIMDPKDLETPVAHFLKIAECYRCTGLLQLYRVFPDLYQSKGTGNYTSPEKSDASDGLVPGKFLTGLAMSVVGLLNSIPVESRTRCVQPFLLVAVAGELRVPISTFEPNHLILSRQILGSEDSHAQTSPTAIEVLQGRKFVMSRLSLFEHILPAKPIQQMLEVVTETWRRMDEGSEDIYWMDIMMEKGWETIMG